MNLHEYQAKLILREYGIIIPDFVVVSSLKEAEEAMAQKKWPKAVVKVQVHAGGRGKAGGVKLAKSPQEILQAVKQLLGMKIVNNQTGSTGVVANQVLISPLVDYVKEYYLGVTIDRKKGRAMLIASPEGGMEIEEIAAKNPDRIVTIPVQRDGSVRGYHLLEVLKLMGWSGPFAEKGKKTIQALAKAFVDTDAALLEINPLVQTKDGEIVALDAKLTLDDNALFRHQNLMEYYDSTQIPVYEARAREQDLAYVALDGEIGCMVNGAGLAMATMDIIQHYGGKPSNFLDVGGSASEEKIAEGFNIILSDPKVKAILVNIFGGIMNCQTLASGIVAATAKSKVQVPLIVRMEGTNVDQGKKLLKDSGLEIILADTLDDAAKKAINAIRKG